MENIKQVNIKNHTYYLFNDMINIKDFNSSLIKIDIYNIGCITIKKINDYENINSVNPLYLIIGKADEYIEKQWKRVFSFYFYFGMKLIILLRQ